MRVEPMPFHKFLVFTRAVHAHLILMLLWMLLIFCVYICASDMRVSLLRAGASLAPDGMTREKVAHAQH